MTNPWDADRNFGSDLVVKTLRDQFPALPVGSVESLGSGWDYDAYLVNGDLVVRFPRRAEVAFSLEREEEILSFVRTRLSDSFATPEITIKGSACAHFPYSFFGHRLIEGVAADNPSAPCPPELASDLGAALMSIHAVPFTGEALGIFETEVERCRERFEETIELFERDDRIESIVPEACEWLRGRPRIPVEFEGVPRFIHNDICPDHLIVDQDTGRLTGIIDWSDAAFGDPVWDFVTLLPGFGGDFLKSVLSAYSLSLDAGFTDRLAFIARISSLKWLMDSVMQETDVRKHVRWVENAFA